MPGKDAPEFSYDPKTKLYRKRIKNEDGRWIPVYGKTKPETRENVRLRKAEITRKIEEANNPLCFQYFADWFKLWSPGKGDKNVESVRNAINNHILPVIGTMRMIDITENDLIELLNKVADKSKSLNDKVLRTLKMVFKAARKEGVTRDDPSADLKAGGKKTEEKIPLTKKQQETLLTTVVGTKIYTFVIIALYTGLRREEVIGLQWDCVELEDEHPFIAVQRSVTWKNNRPIISEILKSNAAHRVIPIVPQLVEFLKIEKEKTKGKFVIGGQYPLTQTGFRRRWEAIENRYTYTETFINDRGKEVTIEHALGEKVKYRKDFYLTLDFHVTPHLLRHTYITRLILAGVNIKVVQYLAGHASVDITLNIYTHLMENQPKDTAGAVFAAFDVVKTLAPVLAPEDALAADLAPIILKYFPELTQILNN